MALYNPGGDAKPIFKYDAKQGVGKIDNDQVPLKNFKAVFDMDTLELGYCRFPYQQKKLTWSWKILAKIG